MALKVQGTRNDSIHRLPPSFLSAKTLQHCKHTGLNQAYFTRSLIINTFFASLPGVNFIRKKARVCGSIASLLYAVCLYRGITLFTLIHDPINGKPDIIVLYQARDNAYAQISAHAQHAGCFFRLYW